MWGDCVRARITCAWHNFAVIDRPNINHVSRPSISPINRLINCKMSSRFFTGGDSDSESSSSGEEELYQRAEESEEESSEEEEEDEEASEDSDDDDLKGGASRFLKPSVGGEESDDSDEDEGERVVKSAKDKRLDEVQQTVNKIENAQKNQDWSIISAGRSQIMLRG